MVTLRDELVSELKSQGVMKSPGVEAAFRAIDRKDFVRPEDVGGAYADHPLSIGYGQTISQPYTVAFMLDLLAPKPGEKILDVGAGSGWTTALLAHMVSSEQEAMDEKRSHGLVIAVERIPELCAFGTANVGKYNFVKRGIAKFLCADAAAELTGQAPFEKILASAATPAEIPLSWRVALAVGGRIVAPIAGSVWRVTKVSATRWKEEEFPGFAFVPLVSNQTTMNNEQ